MLWAQDSAGHLTIDVDGAYRFNYTLTNSTWSHVVLTWNSANLFTLYVNGSSVGTYQAPSTPAYLSRALMVAFGTGYNGYFTGLIDEGRISSTARSAAWIASEFNNQNSPGTFLSVGAQESP